MERPSDRAHVLRLVTEDGARLQHAADNLKRDREIVLAAVKSKGQALEFADPRFQRDNDIVLAAVKNDGMSLKFAGDEQKSQTQIVLAAVKNNGMSLQFAGEKLKGNQFLEGNHNIVLAAVESDGMSLKFAGKGLKSDPAIVVAALLNNRRALDVVDKRAMQKESAMQWAYAFGSATKAHDVYIGKFRAASIRATFEDCPQALCQCAYLLKRWLMMPRHVQAYQIFSIILGIGLSVKGPVEAYRMARTVEPFAVFERRTGENVTRAFTEPRERQAYVPLHTAPRVEDVHDGADGVAADGPSRCMLWASSLIFWVAVLLYPIIRLGDYGCDGWPPFGSLVVFSLALLADLCVQFIVVSRSRAGVHVLSDRVLHTLLEVVYVFFGKFDVFNDAVFVANVWHCPDITGVSFHHYMFHCPGGGPGRTIATCQNPTWSPIDEVWVDFPVGLTLQKISLGVLLVGVIAMQMIPGLVMLGITKQNATALKLNELGVVLLAVSSEAA